MAKVALPAGSLKKNENCRELSWLRSVLESVVEMVMPAGTLQGKHLSNESPIHETLPVLSGSFIAGC